MRVCGVRGPTIESCTIITTAASEQMQELHDRMPVILPPDKYDEWLDPDNEDYGELKRLLMTQADVQFRPVRKYVNNARNEGPECVEDADRP